MPNRRLLRKIAVSASLAVAATTFGSAVVSVPSLRADEPQVAATQEFDKTLLEIPDGETTEFYEKRAALLYAEFCARPSLKPGKNALPVELLSPEQSELVPALATVLLKLADDASLSQYDRDRYFQQAVEFLMLANDLDALRAIVAKEKAAYKASPNNESALRVALTEQMIWGWRFYCVRKSVACRDADGYLSPDNLPTFTPEEEAELNLLGTELIAKVKEQEIPFQPTDAVESWPATARSYLNALENFTPRLGRSFKKELRDVLSVSDDAESREIAERLAAEIRRDELPGQELKLEGVLADGTELDWASYRGKVVWLQARYHFKTTTPFALSIKDPQIAKYKEIYAKYADAGLAVIEYNIDLNAPNADEKSSVPEPGYPILSRRLSADAEKDYADFAALYLLDAAGRALLIDVDGKVVSVRPKAADLEKLLKERFPNVK
ncbi:MAG: hypothetical protein IJE77_01280 [Thermoguttaceae bacterium]|nr:hypothetical protein [Thermoguttaceae bacterium]MBQ9800994.1 hypothetical protein [Thermoguttaceae bacterium]